MGAQVQVGQVDDAHDPNATARLSLPGGSVLRAPARQGRLGFMSDDQAGPERSPDTTDAPHPRHHTSFSEAHATG